MEAEKSILVSPATCAILSRRALELAVKWVYSFDCDLKLPYRDNVSSLIHGESFLELIDSKLFHFVELNMKFKSEINLYNKKDTQVLTFEYLFFVML